MGSFKLKLVAYFALLSLLPVVAAFWGFSSLAGHDETRRFDTRLQAELRTTLALYQEQLAAAQAAATGLAHRSDLQRLLERGDRRGLARFLADRRNVEVALPHGVRVGRPTVRRGLHRGRAAPGGADGEVAQRDDRGNLRIEAPR